MYEASVVAERGPNGPFTFLEGARWHAGRFWFVDLYTDSIYSAQEDGSDVRLEANVPGCPCGLGWLADGRLIAVSIDQGILVRREADGRIVTHADLKPMLKGPGDAPNDMAVTSDGTAYVGCFGFDARAGAPFAKGPILRVTPEGAISVASEALYFPNGSTIVNGKALLVAETFGNRISVFDIGEDGSLDNRRDWATLGPVPDTSDLMGIFPQLAVASDGISAIDAEGAVWVADYIRPRAVRVMRGRGIVDEVKIANDRTCYAAALGGKDGRTLILCTTAADTNPELRRKDPQGQLQSCRVSVPAAAMLPA